MHQRNKSQIRQFLLAAIGDRHFGGTLQRLVAFVRRETVSRKAFHQPPAFHSTHRHAHAVEREGLRHLRAQRVSGIHPQILGVVGPVHVLFIPELVDQLGLGAIGQTGQGARARQRHIARVFALAERLPFRIVRLVEDLGQVARSIERRVALKVEQIGGRGTAKRRMGLRRDVRNAFQKRHIFRMLPEFVVADQRAKRSPAKHAVLFLIDLLEERALVELRSLFDVAQQLFLGCVEYPDLESHTGLAVVHQVLQSAPAAFQFLERRVVKNLIQLQ